MSAKLMRSAGPADFGDLLRPEGDPIMRGETVTALNQLETCVKEAKDLVHQTQVKMEKLAESMDDTDGPPKEARKKSKR
jgi:hypothetical protein